MVILLMGVSGSGKTTVGHLLASQLGWQFADADDYHSPANIKKMRNGVPLTDADRAPWLDSLHHLITTWLAKRTNAILACSALRQSYRDRLRISPELKIIYLRGTQRILHARMHARVGHFMTEAMLASQLDTLEEPADDEAVIVDIAASLPEIVSSIRGSLGL
jgi:gluconokinase